MTWTRRFHSVRDEDLIVDVLNLIERDFKPALDALYVGENLDDFNERALGQIKRLEFPCLAIGPRSNASSPSDDTSYLIQGFRLDLAIGVIDDSDANVTNRIMKYMTTIGEVLRAATKEDMFASATGQTFGYVLESEWEYGPIGSANSILFRGAQMQVTITVNSR